MAENRPTKNVSLRTNIYEMKDSLSEEPDGVNQANDNIMTCGPKLLSYYFMWDFFSESL